MNKYILFISCLFISCAAFAQTGGPDCASAALFPVTLPFSSSTETTCAMSNDYDSTNADLCSGSNVKKFMQGEDKLYAFTPAESGTILIMFTSSLEDSSGLYVFQGCPAGGICIGKNVLVSYNKNLGINVIAGQVYYVMIDGAIRSPDCISNYSINISEPSPDCTAKSFDTIPNHAKNIDFEEGNFANWQTFTGTCCPINTPNQVFYGGRFKITSGTGKDSYTGNRVGVVVPDGGTYSAKLGNTNIGAEAERMRYTFKVTSKTSGIIYKYAVVLQDPGHAPSEQPRFEVVLRNATGDTIPRGTYKVVAGPGIPCFEAFNDVVYKNWTAVGIDLSSYMGEDITIEYSTGDCALGGHFGYAYLDVSVAKLQIKATDYYGSSDTVKFTAPEGFAQYLWNTGANARTIRLPKSAVNPGDTFKVTIVPLQGAAYSSELILTIPENPILNAGFSFTDSLYPGDTVNFTDMSSFSPADAYISDWNWDFGDSTGSNVQNPSHIYTAEGTYDVRLIVTNWLGNLDTVIKKVTIIAPPAAPVADFVYLTEELKVNFTDLSINNPAAWLWDFDANNPGIYTSSERNPVFTYPASGTYQVCLTASNSIGSDQECKTIGVTVGVPSIAPKIVFSPNPVPEKGTLYISGLSPQRAKITYINMLGNEYPLPYRWEQNRIVADVSALSKGVYIVKIQTGKEEFRNKLMIE